MTAKRIADFVEETNLIGDDLLVVDTDTGTFKTKVSTLMGVAHDHTASDVTDLATAVDTVVDSNLQEEQTLTNYWSLMGVTYKRRDLGSINTTANIDLSLAMYHTMTITGATTVSITNVKSGSIVSNMGLRIVNGGANMTWPASVKWPNGEVPVLSVTGTDILNFISDDNGTTWYNIGQVLGLA